MRRRRVHLSQAFARTRARVCPLHMRLVPRHSRKGLPLAHARALHLCAFMPPPPPHFFPCPEHMFVARAARGALFSIFGIALPRVLVLLDTIRNNSSFRTLRVHIAHRRRPHPFLFFGKSAPRALPRRLTNSGRAGLPSRARPRRRVGLALLFRGAFNTRLVEKL